MLVFAAILTIAATTDHIERTSTGGHVLLFALFATLTWFVMQGIWRGRYTRRFDDIGARVLAGALLVSLFAILGECSKAQGAEPMCESPSTGRMVELCATCDHLTGKAFAECRTCWSYWRDREDDRRLGIKTVTPPPAACERHRKAATLIQLACRFTPRGNRC